MDIKIGYCEWVVAYDLLEQIEYAADHGFTSYSLLQWVVDLDAGMKREVAALLKERGLTLTWHANVLGPNIVNDRPNLDYVRRLHDEVIWWHENAGGVYSSCADATTRQATHELVALQRSSFSPRGIRYGIENCCGDRCNASLEQATDIYSLASDDPLMGMILDVGHAHVWATRNGLDMGEHIAALPAPIWEVHISDNHGERDEHLPMGSGTIDYDKLCVALRKKGFSGVFTLEGNRSDGKHIDLRQAADQEVLEHYRETILNAWAASADCTLA